MRQLEVLVVDDDVTILHSVVGILRSYYHLSVAKNKAKALEILARKKTDIVLLDINLPDGNGFDICSQVLGDMERYGRPTLMFMTNQNSVSDEAKGLQLGASDYINKPIHPIVLKARVKLQAELIWRTEELEKLSRIDGLTGVNNRRSFDETLEGYWAAARRGNVKLGLALLDLDYFKQYNDFYGHQHGDLCLRRFAEVLLQVFKRGTDFVSRYGGEEFAILLLDTSVEEVELMLERFSAALNELSIVHQKSPVSEFITYSAGSCVMTPTENSCETIVQLADEQLYYAKRSGRDQHSIKEWSSQPESSSKDSSQSDSSKVR